MTAAILITPERPLLRRTAILAVGPWHSREFLAVTAKIQQLQSASTFASVDEACAQLETAEVGPDLILVAQPLPGGVRQGEVDRLHRLAPLARVVIVVGSWCEGELRTGHPPTGVLRLYWYELESWWQAAQSRLAAGRSPAWSEPLDHPQAGRFIVGGTNEISTPAQLVAVHTDDFAVYECLAAAFNSTGTRTVWTRGEAIPTAQGGIWDGGQLSSRELERLTMFCREVRGPVVALLDFPRLEHLSQAKAAGAKAVFAKPYIVEEVIAALADPRLPLV